MEASAARTTSLDFRSVDVRPHPAGSSAGQVPSGGMYGRQDPLHGRWHVWGARLGSTVTANPRDLVTA
jgi:hypothetical protein